MASVSLKNVYKIYDGGVTAVTDFNLEIADKEFIILVGPSGCGKSTILAVIDTRRSLVKLIIGFLKAFVQHFRSTNSDTNFAVICS